jgi:hypothetical protein
MAILGAGAGATIPTGIATAGLVTQNANEMNAADRMAALNASNRELLEAIKAGGSSPRYQNPGQPNPSRQIYTMPTALDRPNEGEIRNLATGRPLLAPADRTKPVERGRQQMQPKRQLLRLDMPVTRPPANESLALAEQRRMREEEERQRRADQEARDGLVRSRRRLVQ